MRGNKMQEIDNIQKQFLIELLIARCQNYVLSIFSIQLMKNHHKIMDIEDFVNFKINNKERSQSNARAYLLQKKYTRNLDQLTKKRDNKKQELSSMEYEVKKIKKNIWEQLILISNAVQNIQKQRYGVMNKMRNINEQRNRLKREYEQNCQAVIAQQIRLEEQLKLCIAHSEYYFQEKMIFLEEQTENKKAMLRRMRQIEPLVKLCQNKRKNQSDAKERIQKLKQSTQQKVKQIWTLHQRLEQLVKKSKEATKQKQTEDKKNIEDRKNIIVAFLKNMNQILQQKEISDDKISQGRKLIQTKKQQLEQFEFKQIQNSPFKEIKVKQIRQKMFPDKQSNLFASVSVKEQIGQKYTRKIKEWERLKILEEKQVQQLERQEKKLVEEQSSFYSEVSSLQQTLSRLNQNLNKGR